MTELNGKYVNEENHQRVKGKLSGAGKGLLIGGGICLAIGIIALIAGIVLTVTSMGSYNVNTLGFVLIPLGAIFLMPGIAMLSIGIKLKIAANAREIASYGASSVLPVASEAINYTADNIAPAVGKGISNLGKGVGEAAGEIAGGIAEGVRKAKRDLVCPECGEKNINDAKFCASCGYKFAEKKEKKVMYCPNCGDEYEIGQKFCENCGFKLEK